MLFILTTAFSPAPLLAQDSLATDLHDCAAIMGSVERLACYDQLARRPLAAPAPISLLPAKTPQRPVPAPSTSLAADFGADSMPQDVPAPPQRSSLESITSPVADFSFDARGRFTITLANGQIWRQLDGDTPNVPLRKGLTRTATISRAALWSYSIHFDNPRGLFKVVRVR
jgi:hypothetical protein